MEQIPCNCEAGTDLVIESNAEKCDARRQFSHEPDKLSSPNVILTGSRSCIAGSKNINAITGESGILKFTET